MDFQSIVVEFLFQTVVTCKQEKNLCTILSAGGVLRGQSVSRLQSALFPDF